MIMKMKIITIITMHLQILKKLLCYIFEKSGINQTISPGSELKKEIKNKISKPLVSSQE